nr:uncharacterized protein LOC116426365 [Nomia melanderi]
MTILLYGFGAEPTATAKRRTHLKIGDLLRKLGIFQLRVLLLKFLATLIICFGKVVGIFLQYQSFQIKMRPDVLSSMLYSVAPGFSSPSLSHSGSVIVLLIAKISKDTSKRSPLDGDSIVI